MRRMFLLAALLTGLSVTADESDSIKKHNKSPEQRAQKLTEKMEKKLELSPEQKTKVYDINLEFAKKHDELKADGKKDGSKKEKVKALEQEREQKLSSVLTPEQMTKYRELRAKKLAKMKEKRKEQRKKKGE